LAVRKIRANPFSLTGFIPTQKRGAEAANSGRNTCDFESRLERDFATLLEFDVSVATYVEQPLRIAYATPAGRHVTGVPDFLTTFVPSSGRPRELVDVKYRKEIFGEWPRLKPRLRAAKDYARIQGWTYSIMTEVEIETDYLINARFLLPYRRQHSVDLGLIERVKDLVTSVKAATPSAVMAAHSANREKQAQILPTLWHMLASNKIDADLQCRLNMDSRIVLKDLQ
jgi:hypothetical protein